MADSTGISRPMVLGGDRGCPEVCREADRAIRMVVQGREPLLPCGLLEAILRATLKLPFHLQALRRIEVGHKAEQLWGCLPRGGPNKGSRRQGHIGGFWGKRQAQRVSVHTVHS